MERGHCRIAGALQQPSPANPSPVPSPALPVPDQSPGSSTQCCPHLPAKHKRSLLVLPCALQGWVFVPGWEIGAGGSTDKASD